MFAVVLLGRVEGGPTLYKLEGEMAEEIKIPVSSTGNIVTNRSEN